MSTESTISDAIAPQFNSLSSTDEADKEPSSTPAENEKAKHDIPLVVANSTTYLPSKVDLEDLKNGNKLSTNDDSQLQPSHASSEIEKEAAVYQALASEVLQDGESEFEAQDLAERAVYESKEVLKGEKAKLRTRSRQAILHLAYTEERVKNLEEEVKKLRRDVHKLPDDFKRTEPDDFEVAKPPVHPVYLHELKRTTIQGFQLNEESNTIPNHLRPALEVLLDDRSPLLTSSSEEGTTNNNSTGHHSPEKLRIRPQPLAKHITQICGYPDSGVALTYIPDPQGRPKPPSPMVFLRPFKLFITFETAIRASVQELEAQIESKVAKGEDLMGKSQQEKDQKHHPSEYGDKDLLIDLKLLIEFFDVDLKTTFELRNKIRDGRATAIEYPDLWHLFQLGEDVIHQSSRLTVYRVINITVRIVLHTSLTAPLRNFTSYTNNTA
jgi:hypothetical protein